MSVWHWFILLLLLAAPFFLIYLAVRAGVRSGMKSAQREQPPTDGGKGAD